MEWSLTGVPLPIILRPFSPLTDDELLLLSSKNRGLRIEKNGLGELTIMTPVGGEGGYWEASINARLTIWADDDGRGLAFSPNTGFNLPDGSMLSPDAAWVALDRWETLTAEQRRKYPPLCPDFVIELLSSTDSLHVLKAKMQVWIDSGAQLAWLVDPYKATVTIYRTNQAPEVLHKPTTVDGEGPVVGFCLTTAKLWAPSQD